MVFPAIILVIDNDDDRLFMQTLYEDYHHLMLNVARKILHGIDGADDAVSNALMSLIRNIKTLRGIPGGKLLPYIVLTVRNACYDMLRKQQRHDVHNVFVTEEDLHDTQSDEPDVDQHLIIEAEISELQSAMAKLPDKEVHLLQMKYLLQVSDKEIAATLGVKMSSVRQYLTNARRHLVALLDKGN